MTGDIYIYIYIDFQTGQFADFKQFGYFANFE